MPISDCYELNKEQSRSSATQIDKTPLSSQVENPQSSPLSSQVKNTQSSPVCNPVKKTPPCHLFTTVEKMSSPRTEEETLYPSATCPDEGDMSLEDTDVDDLIESMTNTLNKLPAAVKKDIKMADMMPCPQPLFAQRAPYRLGRTTLTGHVPNCQTGLTNVENTSSMSSLRPALVQRGGLYRSKTVDQMLVTENEQEFLLPGAASETFQSTMSSENVKSAEPTGQVFRSIFTMNDEDSGNMLADMRQNGIIHIDNLEAHREMKRKQLLAQIHASGLGQSAGQAKTALPSRLQPLHNPLTYSASDGVAKHKNTAKNQP